MFVIVKGFQIFGVKDNVQGCIFAPKRGFLILIETFLFRRHF